MGTAEDGAGGAAAASLDRQSRDGRVTEGERMEEGEGTEEEDLPFIANSPESASVSPRDTNDGGLEEGHQAVEDAINHVGFGRFQVGILLYAGLSWLADAAEMVLLSFVGPAAQCEWNLSSVQEGAISSAVFVGILIGGYSWGIMSDLRGRRQTFLVTVFFTTICGFLSAVSPTYWFLLLSRAFVGFGLGGASVAFSLCMEFLPENGRSFWLVFLDAFWSVGTIAEGLLAWIIIPNFNWRWLVAVSAVPFVFLLLSYPALPESPRYLMTKGDREGAIKVLRRVAMVNGRALPHGMISAVRAVDMASTGSERDELKLTEGHVEAGLQVTGSGKQVVAEGSRPENGGVFGPLKMLVSPEFRKTTLTIWFLFFANAFLYYGIVLLTTKLQVFGKERPCNDPATTIVDDSTRCHPDGKPAIDSSQYLNVLISCLAEFPGLIAACFLVERVGRKVTIASLLIGCGLFLFPLVTPLHAAATTFFMFGSRSCINGAFTVLWAHAPELYHTKVRATGVGAANSAGRVGGFLCPFVAVDLIESCRRMLAVGLFAGCSMIAAFTTFLFPKEKVKRAAPGAH